MSGHLQIGRRIAALRETHGDSLRAAAERTGVSHTTIARLERGETSTSLHRTLRKIAAGYGVTIEYLLTQRDPCQEFRKALSVLPPEERSRLYFTSRLHRTQMLLRFLIAHFPQEFPCKWLAESLGMSCAELEQFLATEEESAIPAPVLDHTAEVLSRLTGVPTHWFSWGHIGGEPGGSVPPETFAEFVAQMKRAKEAGIRPEVLDRVIDMLILKYKEPAPH